MSFNKNPNSIHGNRLFQDVSPKDIKINISSKNFVEVNGGEIIYQVGDNSDSLYLLLKGEVKIKFYGSISGPSLLKKLEKDFFGEVELLEKTPRKSTAMTVEKSLVYIMNGKELKELTKSTRILANLFNPASAIGANSQKPFDELENSSEINIDEYNSIENFMETGSSSITSSLKPEDFDEGEDDLGWNSSNIDEFKDSFNDDELFDDEEMDDYSLDNEEEIDYDRTNLPGTIDRNDSPLESVQHDEPNALINTQETFSNNDNSILDHIKAGLKENIFSEFNPPAASSIESNMLPQGYEEHLATKEYHEIVKKITRSITDEISTPIELIKKYAGLLMQKSSSAEANKVLQKIIDQSDIMINSLQIHTDYFNEELKLKTHVLFATNVLNDILHLLAGYTEFRKVKLFRKFEADASILLDKNLFYQAGLQIVKFLCAHITGEGSIFVTTGRAKDTIIIEFKSNGPKLPDEQLKKISGEIISIENPGLGFARRIITEHNGTLTVQNSTDSGPKIKVLLPIVK